MATQSVIHPARQSRSRKAFAPEEILKVLRIASESKRKLAMILVAYRRPAKFAICGYPTWI
jgi:hypothetical protein